MPLQFFASHSHSPVSESLTRNQKCLWSPNPDSDFSTDDLIKGGKTITSRWESLTDVAFVNSSRIILSAERQRDTPSGGTSSRFAARRRTQPRFCDVAAKCLVSQMRWGGSVKQPERKVALQRNWPEFLKSVNTPKDEERPRSPPRSEINYVGQLNEMCDPKLNPEQEKICYKWHYTDNWWNMNVEYRLDNRVWISWFWSFYSGCVREYPSS